MSADKNLLCLYVLLQSVVLLPSSGGKGFHYVTTVEPDDPVFEEPIKSLSVKKGGEAVLNCSIFNLGKHKISWLRAENESILSLHDQVLAGKRFSLSLVGQRVWQLRIKPVEEADHGCYICQVNTKPVVNRQIGCLRVLVPPKFNKHDESPDVSVMEHDNASLVCNPVGFPEPTVTWRKASNETMMLRIGNHDLSREYLYEGRILPLFHVDRYQMGDYICKASNGMKPDSSRRVRLNVNFKPEIETVDKETGIPQLSPVFLEFMVSGYPEPLILWKKPDGARVKDSPSYMMDQKNLTLFKRKVRLQITMVDKNDYGNWTCIASNSFGKAQGTTRLIETKVFNYSLLGGDDKMQSLYRNRDSENVVLSRICLYYFITLLILLNVNYEFYYT